MHAELVRAANAAKTLTMDETGWRVGWGGAWMWAATNTGITLYWVTPGRGFPDATTVVDAGYTGTIIRDGWVVYSRYDQATH